MCHQRPRRVASPSRLPVASFQFRLKLGRQDDFDFGKSGLVGSEMRGSAAAGFEISRNDVGHVIGPVVFPEISQSVFPDKAIFMKMK